MKEHEYENYEPDPFGEEDSNILDLTPPAGSPNMLNPEFPEASGNFSGTIELDPNTLMALTPPDGLELKNRRRNILSVAELTRKGLMKVVRRNQTGDPSKELQMGFLHHSPSLQEALSKGELEPLLRALSDSYREIYGNDPWNEYLCCSNPTCTGTLSLEDVYGAKTNIIDLKTLEAEIIIDPKDYKCPKDGSSMEYFYPPEKHLKSLRNGFHQEVFATLLFEGDHRLVGFCLGWETSVEDGWKDKVIPGKGDEAQPKLTFEEYMDEALRLFGEGTQPQDKVLNVAEWGIDRNIQGKGTALSMMRELYSNALEKMQSSPADDFGVFAHSLDGSRAFKVTSKIGFQWGKTLSSGERRAYLKLKKAIEGIDRMMGKETARIVPIDQAESVEKQIPRDTLVIEMLCNEAVGSDENGNKKVHQYLFEVAKIMGLKPMGDTVTHLSPKYGLSGWLPLEGGSAIHLYAWDYEDGSHPPFLSIDISTPGVIANPEGIVQHAEKFFNGEQSVKKKMQEKENSQWHEIAPQIHRQRISIAGKSKEPLTAEKIKSYLKNLAPALDMVQLSEPLVIGNTGWMHWETSGTVLTWDDKNFYIDIYTCKPFTPQTAIDFTISQLGLENFHHKNF
jgi:S-adenosylmethionine decarboxylase